MKGKNNIWRLWLAGLVLAVFASCEKEIDVDYHEVAPIYVAEVELTPYEVTARLTTTRPVKGDNSIKNYVDNAIITVFDTSAPDFVDTLKHRANGRYRLDYWALENMEYQVDISIDGQRYSSTSTLLHAPKINSFAFVWKDFLSERMLFADLRIQDVPFENNYYFMHIYRNGIGYRWAVMRDSPNPGGELQQLFTLSTEREINKGTSDNIIQEGDRIRVEVRSVCKTAYDYLYSLQLMENTGTNPLPNFTNGMLGYFSAFQSQDLTTVFRTDSVGIELIRP